MASTAATLRLQPTTVPPGPRRPARPPLRVLEGGRAPGRVAQQARYRRRRLAVAVVALVALLLAAAAVAGIAGGGPSAVGASSPAPAAASSAAGAAAPATVVVQPGDTLWSIAAATQPGVDVRIAVDRLVALNGGAPLVPGQELLVP